MVKMSHCFQCCRVNAMRVNFMCFYDEFWWGFFLSFWDLVVFPLVVQILACYAHPLQRVDRDKVGDSLQLSSWKQISESSGSCWFMLFPKWCVLTSVCSVNISKEAKCKWEITNLTPRCFPASFLSSFGLIFILLMFNSVVGSQLIIAIS